MKRIFALLLALVLLFSLAGCSADQLSVTEPTPAKDVSVEKGSDDMAPVSVSSVDELLAAIAPGRKIYLAAGSYVLNTASDYGKSESPYYTWMGLGLDQYELQLKNVEGLTIFGAGQEETQLITEPRWANVLSMMNCTDITLENMTLGHTQMTDVCEGGVLRVEGCEDIQLKQLGLYGCGTVGLLAFESQNVTMRSCEVYDCSVSALQISRCEDVTVKGSFFHDLGKENPVMEIFSISESEDVLLESNAVYDNYSEHLLWSSGNVTLRHNQITNNRLCRAAFNISMQGVVLDDNVFEENDLRNWYVHGSARAVDANGAEVEFDAPVMEPLTVTPGEAKPVSEAAQKEVRVSNADDFLAAIAPDTCIILDAALLDLSQAQSYQHSLQEFRPENSWEETYTEEYHPYCYWLNTHDGPTLIISGVKNLTIKAEGNDRKANTISSVPRYSDVLTFENCEDLTLSGFTAGHTKEPGQCTGGVFMLKNCDDVLIDNCGMYGCGTEGVSAESSRNIQVVNSEIYECSYAGIQLYQCENVAISGTVIRDIGDELYENAPYFQFAQCSSITLDGKPLDGNYMGN